jgi:hypothetical protein
MYLCLALITSFATGCQLPRHADVFFGGGGRCGALDVTLAEALSSPFNFEHNASLILHTTDLSTGDYPIDTRY